MTKLCIVTYVLFLDMSVKKNRLHEVRGVVMHFRGLNQFSDCKEGDTKACRAL